VIGDLPVVLCETAAGEHRSISSNPESEMSNHKSPIANRKSFSSLITAF
jgi:hypothetical protein